ncbi:class II aldolase/adducin family protein [Thermogladius sp. 4427co]|uniref:class II aldolase/adducin family protein n=1 Tax=Thermogladius sp. 4427co TaxID=3450718 RepID=UPI003F7AC619
MSSSAEPREKLVNAMRELFFLGLINPRGGNGSVYLGEGWIAITPSGVGKQWLKPEELVLLNIETGELKGSLKPSIEVNAHVLTYKKINRARSVLHAHPPVTLALTDLFHDRDVWRPGRWWETGLIEVEYSVGKAEIAHPYPPGSVELANEVSDKFASGARLVIVPKHGVFAWGESVEEAMDAIVAIELVAKYVAVKSQLTRQNLLAL